MTAISVVDKQKKKETVEEIKIIGYNVWNKEEVFHCTQESTWLARVEGAVMEVHDFPHTL